MLGQCTRFAKSKSLLGDIFQECHDMTMMCGWPRCVVWEPRKAVGWYGVVVRAQSAPKTNCEKIRIFIVCTACTTDCCQGATYYE